MSRIFRLALLLASLLCVQGLAVAEVARGVAEEMVRKSGLWESLGSVSQQVKASFSEVGRQGESPLTAAEIEQLGRAAEAAYAPARLRASAVGAVARVMAPNQLGELRAWYDSPRGKSITAIEEAAAASTQRPEDAIREGQRVYSAATPARQALVGRISDAIRAPEAMANLAINTAVAMQQGVSRVQGQQGTMSPAELRAALGAQKPQMMQAFSSIVLASFALAYANVGDKDLDAYASFLEGPAGMKFTGQSLLAYDQALSQAGREFGQALAAARPKAST